MCCFQTHNNEFEQEHADVIKGKRMLLWCCSIKSTNTQTDSALVVTTCKLLYMKAILETATGRIFIGGTDAEAEAPILRPPDSKTWLIRKDPDAEQDWRWEEKGTTEDEIVGWHHWLNGHEFEQAPGVGDGQGSLECCSPWGRMGSKELGMTERLNWTELSWWCSGKESTSQCRRHKRYEFQCWVGKIPRVGNGNPLQYSCLENLMDRRAWWATVRGVAKSWTRLNTHTHTHHTPYQFLFLASRQKKEHRQV